MRSAIARIVPRRIDFTGVLSHSTIASSVSSSDWQVRTVDGRDVINDHTDAAYDAAVREKLCAFHAESMPLIDEICAHRLAPAALSFALSPALRRRSRRRRNDDRQPFQGQLPHRLVRVA